MTEAERSLVICVAEELLSISRGSRFADEARMWLRAVKKEAGIPEPEPVPQPKGGWM